MSGPFTNDTWDVDDVTDKEVPMGAEQRMEVIKHGISEREQTARKRLEEREQTRRALHATEGYHVTRGIALFTLLVLGCFGGCAVVNASGGVNGCGPSQPKQHSNPAATASP